MNEQKKLPYKLVESAEDYCQLGKRCEHGLYGIEMNHAAAFRYYRKAALMGHAEAQYCLGGCYERGVGVCKDYGEAKKWYHIAAENGSAYAAFSLGLAYLGQCEKCPYPYDAGEAVKWLLRAEKLGGSDILMRTIVQETLGFCYYQGKGVSQSYKTAIEWFQKSAASGFAAESERMLGICYFNGTGTPEDHGKAAVWFEKAAERGNRESMYRIGRCYYDGDGVKQKYTEAVFWFRQASLDGDIRAQYQYGMCLKYGKGIKKNKWEANKWLSFAAKQGNQDAIDELNIPVVKTEKRQISINNTKNGG